MNDGAYIYKWLPAITDKEDKRCYRLTRTKGRTVNSIRLGIPDI